MPDQAGREATGDWYRETAQKAVDEHYAAKREEASREASERHVHLRDGEVHFDPPAGCDFVEPGRVASLPPGVWICVVCDEPQDGAKHMAADTRVPCCYWCWAQTASAARVFSDDHQAAAHGEGCPCP